MAFHPFKHFRKYQKVYLAIVTILTMFIFIFTGFASRRRRSRHAPVDMVRRRPARRSRHPIIRQDCLQR